jgi:hypothetical protein
MNLNFLFHLFTIFGSALQLLEEIMAEIKTT